MVQNGKFSAAAPCSVSKLNKDDLPTLGRPTTPIFSDVFTRPHLAAPAWPSVVSTFFGGILRATSPRAVGGAALRVSEENKLQYVSLLRTVGPLLVTVSGMLSDVSRFAAVYTFVFVGFANAFFVLFALDDEATLCSIWLQYAFSAFWRI